MTAPMMPDFAINATRVSVRDGLWSDPSVWGGTLPAGGDVVRVLNAVAYDLPSSPRLAAVGVDGRLDVRTDLDTALNVGTLQVNEGGTLTAGSCLGNVPVTRSFTLTFLNLPLDPVSDPGQFGRGLIVAGGTLDLCGSANKTAWLLVPYLKAGDTTITLPVQPADWAPGEILLIPGCAYPAAQDEEVAIASVSGSVVTLARPLVFDHYPMPGPQGEVNSLPVANLSRRIVIRSEDPVNGRGHCMFMRGMMTRKPATANTCHVAVDGCGRTDAFSVVTDPKLDASGKLIPGTDANPRARYGWHWHRNGQLNADGTFQTPQICDSIVVTRSKKVAVNNHDSSVTRSNCVVYAAQGTGFFTENGRELGTDTNNLAVRIMGTGILPDADQTRTRMADFGHGGHGFWYQGPGVVSRGNYAIGCTLSGYEVYQRSPVNLCTLAPQVVTETFPAAYLPNPPAKDPPIQTVAPLEVSDNVVGCCQYGHRSMWCDGGANGAPVFFRAVAWNCVNGGRARDHGLVWDSPVMSGPNYAAKSVGIGQDFGYSFSSTIRNGSIGGYETGVATDYNGACVIRDTYLANVWDISVWSQGVFVQAEGGRTYSVVNPTFGPVPAPALAGRTRANYKHSPLFSAGNLVQQPFVYFLPLQFLIPNGQQVFSQQQAPDYVPFPSSQWPADWPQEILDKTNAEIQATLGLAIAGVLAGPDATPDVGGGLIGSAQPMLPQFYLVSAQKPASLTGYLLSYAPRGATSVSQVVNEKTPRTLHPGWNALRPANGDPTTLFVFGPAS